MKGIIIWCEHGATEVGVSFLKCNLVVGVKDLYRH